MARLNFDKSLKLLLPDEGGFTHDRDGGGDTYKGVTQTAYDRYRLLHNRPKQAVTKITDEEVTDFYRTEYWNIARCDDLPAGIDYAVFDYAVNSGPIQAAKDLQRVLTVSVDGHVGTETLLAARDANSPSVIAALCARRLAFMKTLSNWKTNKNGWPSRVAGVQKDAIAMTTPQEQRAAPVIPVVPVTTLPQAASAPPVAVQAQAPARMSQQSVVKTRPGIGAIIAASGVTGQGMFGIAGTIKPQIGDSLFGHLALAAFAIVMTVGVALIVYDVYRKAAEKAATS